MIFGKAQRHRSIAAAAMLFTFAMVHQAQAMQAITWVELIDDSVQSFEDPYAALSSKQLSDLVTVARLRARLEDQDIDPEPRNRIETRLTALQTELTDSGVDIDWLISQRWVVADRRKIAATSGNPEVNGELVTMTGFAIPAPMDDDGSAVAYLVPERGMCSHMPPPNPNQMIRIRYPAETRALLMHEPVRVTGQIDIAPTQKAIHVVDGLVPMHATFALQASTLEPLAQKPFSALLFGGDRGSSSVAEPSIMDLLPAHRSTVE